MKVILPILFVYILMTSGCAHYSVMQYNKHEMRTQRLEAIDAQKQPLEPQNVGAGTNTIDNVNLTPASVTEGHNGLKELLDLWDWQTFKAHPIRESIALIVDLIIIYKLYLI